MRFVQCVLGAVSVYAVRDAENLPRLIVSTWTPVPVPETAEDRAELAASADPRRFIPFENARRYVETGGKAWEWVVRDGEAPPKPRLSGPLPDGFPHAAELRAAGFGVLELVPKGEVELMRVPGLLPVNAETGKAPSAGAKRKAAHKILDAIDSIALNKKGA